MHAQNKLIDTVYDILHDLDHEADLSNCFSEAVACCEKLGLTW
jgi:hypothetical protein